MIILFHITDCRGLRHRCSAVCGPSTTAAGAINQLRTKLCIPTEVEVEVHLANDVPIRHLTAPLTSLRKQRGSSAQVLRMQLWANLSGPESAVKEINYAAAEVVDPADVGAEEEKDDEINSAYTHLHSSSQSEQRHSSSMPHSASTTNATNTRIMFAGPPSRANVKPVQAKVPSNLLTPVHSRPMLAELNTAATSNNPVPAPMSQVPSPSAPARKDGSHEPRTSAAGAAPVADPTPTPPPPALTSPTPESAAATLVIKRRDSRPPPTPRMVMPLSARGPVRRPPVDVQRAELQVPQSARGVAPARHMAPTINTVAAAPAGCTECTSRHVEAAMASNNDAQMQYRTGVARRDAAIGQIMLREYPKIVPREPKAIVVTVKENKRLASLSFSKEFTATSDLDGVDDGMYARYLSIGLTHGLELRRGAEGEGARVALYGELSSLRHSCCPNATVQYDFFTAPYAGSCRCAVLSGIPQGQEITYLYKHADSLAFLLLSRDRRRNILQRKYFIECDCPRCTEIDTNETDAAAAAAPIVKKKGCKTGAAKAQKLALRTKAQREAEATLTGAFFTDSTVDRDVEKQKALMEEMRKDFDALQIIDDTGVEIALSLVGNVPPIQRTKQCNRLLAFLRKYGTAESVLRLHEHHWRMNLARAAYVQETVRLCAVKGATPEARLRDPHSMTLFTPTKTVYDICLKQLAVEALFIPPGHPHTLTTYESFLYLVAILPPAFAQTVTRSAHNMGSVKWKQLEETKEAWSVLKRTTLPPQVRQLVQLRENASTSGSGASAGAPGLRSQPTTARGQRTQDLPAAPTIKLPPQKAKTQQS